MTTTWRRLESPKFQIPLEMREVSPPGTDPRVWEVQELRGGCMFKATLSGKVLEGGGGRGASRGRGLSEAEVERAVCLAVEDSLLSPPEKEPGETYEVFVSQEQVYEAALLSG